MTFIKPIQTADAEMITDAETGETVGMIEHYAQGDYRYRIVWRDGEEPRIEDDWEAEG